MVVKNVHKGPDPLARILVFLAFSSLPCSLYDDDKELRFTCEENI